MYGLLIQSCVDYLKCQYGEDMWLAIQRKLDISNTVFNTHTTYNEELMVKMANAAAEITGNKVEDVMDAFGVAFVAFVGQFGYDRILKVLGRNMRDFLNGLDNLHEYLRFSYPQLKPPSFFVEDETKNGLTLTYRSKRKGFVYYVKGQIRQVGKQFYDTTVNIYVVANDFDEETQTTHVKYRLMFDNKAFKEIANRIMDNVVESIPLQPELLFELFPFHIVFSRKLIIRSMGQGLRAIMPTALGKSILDFFKMERPLSNMIWDAILKHTNNVFQLSTKTPVFRSTGGNPRDRVSVGSKKDPDAESIQKSDDTTSVASLAPLSLSFKGQMLYIHEWDCIMFLGTPIMSSLDDMFRAGLYINDLSMHDSSRDLVLAGTQQSAELKLALDQEQEKSRLLEQSMVKLDQEMQRTDALLYQMIPKSVAERLRRGERSVDTCEVFDSVTILFSDVVGFTTICSKITPMEVVSMLNAMYTKFDHLSENHSVYKVETIGDAYMAVSGAPNKTDYHAQHMSEMAMDMIASMYDLRDPSSDEHMKLRIGIHTGTTVAGVVGIKMPRYCLFGDTVNTASRMESGGEAMRIHISETTKLKLEGFPYKLEERGSIQVKGKGEMKTYWLTGRKNTDKANAPKCPFLKILEEEVGRLKKRDGINKLPSIDADEAVSASLRRAVSPVPYSPVSFHDVDDAHTSLYAGSAASSRNNSVTGLGNSPHRPRSNTVGCPFAGRQRTPTLNVEQNSLPNTSGFLKSSNIEESNNIIKSVDCTQDSLRCPSSFKDKTIPANTTVDTRNSSGNNKNDSNKNCNSENNRTTKPSLPESIDSGISIAVTNNHSNPISKNNKISAETSISPRTPTKTVRTENVSTSPSRFRPQVTDGIARVAPMVTKTPNRMNVGPEVKGNPSDLGTETENRAPSTATIKSVHSRKNIYTPSSLNNFQGSDSPTSNPHRSSIGNGSVGEIESESKAGVYTRKMDDSALGKSEVVGSSKTGCLVRHSEDETKTDRKSKTCYIL